MKFIKSINSEVDRMMLDTEKNSEEIIGIVLYADKDTCVVLQYDNEGVVREDTAPVYVIWTFVSTAHPDLCDYPDKTFNFNGVDYDLSAAEISDVSPYDQSDLSNPGAIAADPPEVYHSFEELHSNWSNPNSKQIKNLISSITGFSPAS